MPLLPRVEPGQAPTLDHASEVNRIIDAINMIMRMRVSPPTAGSVKLGESEMILDLADLQQLIEDKITEAIDSLSIAAVCNADGSITVTLSRP